jgi:hypothetical protein
VHLLERKEFVVFLIYSGFKIIEYSNNNRHSTVSFVEVEMQEIGN